MLTCRAGVFLKRDPDVHGEEGQAKGRGGKKREKTPASRAYEIKGWYQRDGN